MTLSCLINKENTGNCTIVPYIIPPFSNLLPFQEVIIVFEQQLQLTCKPIFCFGGLKPNICFSIAEPDIPYINHTSVSNKPQLTANDLKTEQANLPVIVWFPVNGWVISNRRPFQSKWRKTTRRFLNAFNVKWHRTEFAEFSINSAVLQCKSRRLRVKFYLNCSS